MYNRVNFSGNVSKNTLNNSQVIKFVVEQENKKVRRITATVFKSEENKEIVDIAENAIGENVVVAGEIYETAYKDKDGKWNNSYCIQVDKIVVL